MADLPTPHAIAIGALLSLYSDPTSPLIDWHSSSSNSSTAADDGDVDDGGRDYENDDDEYDGRPQSTADWTLRLMQLLHQLVLREDEGIVLFPSNSNIILSRGEDDDDSTAAAGVVDPIHVIEDTELRAQFSSGAGDGYGDLLDDMIFDMFPSCDHRNTINDKMDMTYKKSYSPSDFLPGPSSSSRGGDGYASLFVGQELHLDHNHQSSLNFCMESLSTLLDRMDDVFLHCPSSSVPAMTSKHLNGRKRSRCGSNRRKRTPPSQALLKRLQMASTSVDDLMNLLDEWHAMLEGTPLPSSTGSSSTTTIVMDGESTFGIYLRKLCLGMEEIPFEALSRLWDALRKFVEEEIACQQQGDAHAQHLRMRRNDATGDNDYGGNDEQDVWNSSIMPVYDWLPSSPQIERIVRNTCLDPNLDSLLKKRPQSRTQHPSASRQCSQQLFNLLETHPECPSVHFLMYLSSLANGYRSQALECLHRYFDYAMIHERKERAERQLMLQACAVEGGGALTTSGGIMGTVASGMGGITGGMTGGIINGRMMHGGAAAGQPQRGGGAAGPGGGGQAATVKVFKESNVMQYAAILLAQTYYRFGYARLSLQATEEAIRVAQQSGDEECVCFANAWSALVSSSLGGSGGGVDGNRSGERRNCRTSVYARVGGIEGGVGGGSALQNRPLLPLQASLNCRRRRREDELLLRRCRARASERGLSLLAASASLELARLLTYRRQQGDDDDVYGDEGFGDSSGREDESSFGCVASSAWDSVQDAGRMFVAGSGGPSSSTTGRGAVLHRQGGASSSLTFGQPAPTDIYNMTPVESTSILRQQNIAISSLWESTGHLSLSALSTCAALDSGNKAVSSLALNRVLSSTLNGQGLDIWKEKGDSYGESRFDHQHFGLAYSTILRSVELFENAEDLLKSSVAASTLHEWSVRSYDLSLAQGMNILLANRAAFPCPHSSVDVGGALPSVESALAFLTHSSHLSRQRGEYDKAKAFTRRACWLANQHELLFHLGSNLIQLSLIELDGASSPTSAPERSLPPLLECLELSERYSMDPLRSLALSILARVILCMGRANGQGYRKARALLRASFPLVMEHGSLWFQGEAFLTLAKCYLAEAAAGERPDGEEAKNSSTTQKLRKSALYELKKSANKFEAIEDVQRLRQVYYLQARVYHLLPNSRKERDDAANTFARFTAAMCERLRNPPMTAHST